MGADPGTTNVYAAYAAKHLLDVVTELRVRDGDNSVCQGTTASSRRSAPG